MHERHWLCEQVSSKVSFPHQGLAGRPDHSGRPVRLRAARTAA